MKCKYSCMKPYVFDPWQRVKVPMPSNSRVEHPKIEGSVEDVPPILEIAVDAIWKQPIRWNKKQSKDGFLCPVILAPTCNWSDCDVPPITRDRLWQIIGNTICLTWLLVSKRATDILLSLPEDWGGGYWNVALGVIVERVDDLQQIDILRKIRTKERFLEVSTSLEAPEMLNLKGIHFVIVRIPSCDVSDRLNKKWYRQLKEHCRASDVKLEIVRT